MKNKEWLKEQLSYLQDGVGESFNDYSKGLNAAYNTLEILINELDEPDQDINVAYDLLAKITTLSQEDFDLYWNCINDGVAVSELKQDKVVIPQFVADYYETVKHLVLSAQFDKFKYAPDKKVWNWYRECEGEYPNPEANAQLVIAMIKLGRYEVEKEKRYTACFAPIGTRQGVYLYRENGSIKVGDNMKVYDKNKQEYHLTEQEIRNRDERFWDFAEEVTK